MSNPQPNRPTSRRQDTNATAPGLESEGQWRGAGRATDQDHSGRQNANIQVSYLGSQPPTSAPTSRTTTIAPSPPPNNLPLSSQHPTLAALDTSFSSHISTEPAAAPVPSPLTTGLRIQTDIVPGYTVTAASTNNTARSSTDSLRGLSKPIGIAPARAPSVKTIFAGSVGSNSNLYSAPNSAASSPMLSAMADVTPLPSPLLSGDSPGPWKKLSSRPPSREMMIPITADSALVTANGESISSAIANQSKRRAYHGLLTNANESGLAMSQTHREKDAQGHTKSRSISEYVPEAVQLPKVRQVTVSGSHVVVLDTTQDPTSAVDMQMRREPNLAIQRGLAPIPRPPTPPSSRTGGESSDSDSSLTATTHIPRAQRKPRYEHFEARTRGDFKMRRWRALKVLGQGTFSRVMLATTQVPEEDNRIDENHAFDHRMDSILSPAPTEPAIDSKKLVAIKICEHGPKGGASEERVEVSLKRELEIMKSINHPSLVHLKAWNIEKTRAILVLSYCPGGDLFEVASQHRDLLVPAVLRRMFAELVGAVRYLHERHIVHRDIKLENVLVNLPPHELARPLNWVTYPYSIITLTDLGLSRRVADDEKLTTRCGSDDYAAPEVIMGQPYDGRATDAWSLGVLLYALLESRLPFDPNPGLSEGHKQRSRTSHRIARVEWRWVQYAGDEGDHEGDPSKFREMGLEGAMVVTEGLLKRARSRWTLEKVAGEDWVKGAVQVEGGIRFREEDNPEEVLGGGGDRSPL